MADCNILSLPAHQIHQLSNYDAVPTAHEGLSGQVNDYVTYAVTHALRQKDLIRFRKRSGFGFKKKLLSVTSLL